MAGFLHGKEEQKLEKKERNKTRRGKGKRKKKKDSPLYFSLLGLKAKIDSLINNVAIFDKPSCILIQETKLRKSGMIELPGYQIFQLIRNGFGGGLLTAVDVNLSPVLVTAEEDVEILVIQIKIGEIDIRIFNAYGPQEDEVKDSLNFWSRLEQEIILAKQSNCWILVEMDANAKLDSNLHKMTENGRFMLGMVQRQNLVILNNLAVCTGQITRQRITREREEKANS